MKFSLSFALVLLTSSPLIASNNAKKNSQDLFPSSYEDSRASFRALCQEAASVHHGRCSSFVVPSSADSDLTIDYGYFSNSGKYLVVVQSGVHGPETYAGAAVQMLFMKKYLNLFLKSSYDVLLIHSINPYGFKYGRRADENNINLNRNFEVDNTIFSTPNPAYEKLRGIFEPNGPVKTDAGDSFKSHLGFLLALAKNKFAKTLINDGMNSGQYFFEKGINYGGKFPEPQTQFLKETLRPFINAYKEIIFLDFHTGLGDKGVLHVITGLHPPAKLLLKMKSVWEPLKDKGIKFTTANDPGFYPTTGDVVDYVPTLANEPDNVIALTMEYGTMGTDVMAQLRSASRIVLENQSHFYGCSKPKVCKEVSENFLELFNPSDLRWRAQVLEKAELIFSKLL